jgi:glucosamine-6-phosphate deaminase
VSERDKRSRTFEAPPAGIRTRVFDDVGGVARAAADLLADELRARPDLALALPTGNTPLPFYDELAARHAAKRMDLGRARGFNLDEIVLPPEDPRTFRSYMERHAWGRTGLARERCDIPNGGATDLEAECRRYEQAIADAGGLELAIVGLGVDGHIAYNMPGPVGLPTHVTRLPDGLAASLGVPPEDWPLRALTMGIGTIRSARRILLMATGESKALAVFMMVHGAEDPEWPCTFFRNHPRMDVLLDAAAAARLRRVSDR